LDRRLGGPQSRCGGGGEEETRNLNIKLILPGVLYGRGTYVLHSMATEAGGCLRTAKEDI